ncbi:flagellar brake protein [Marinimicrobium agarilyticum]|uniref:flagellar brake protein n=1 Tax=Marinimicrobium agarilyticum TaxID=306546 RepID=UPI00041ABEBE|nr:flagellar brake protein [Marinimicrobium agarilyticum]
MNFEDLKLRPGYPLQLQVQTDSGMSDRYPSRFIGAVPGRALMITVPRINGRFLRLRPGQQVVARMMVSSGVGVFTCTVETQATDPYPLLHLDYPEEVGFKGIRQSARVEVDLPVIALNQSSLETNELPARIVDISLSGARLELDRLLGEIGDKVTLTGQVDVAGLHRDLRLEAVIRSRVERSTQELKQKMPVVYGMEFADTDDTQRLTLAAYVYAQLAQEQLPSL